jgi:hypothetical protein
VWKEDPDFRSSYLAKEVSSLDEFEQNLEIGTLDRMCQDSATLCKTIEDQVLQAEFEEKQRNGAGTSTTAKAEPQSAEPTAYQVPAELRLPGATSKLSEPGRTLSSSRSLFFEQATEKFILRWIEVQEQIQHVAATRSAAGLRKKHEQFRSGLDGWLESVVKLVYDEVGRLSKIGACHPTWLGDADPAQWARLNVQKFLSEWLRQEVSTQSLVRAFQQGTSLLRSKNDLSSHNSRPAVENWFRMASEGQKYPSCPRSTKPWRAPVWCFSYFREPWWIRLGRPSHLTVDQTKAVLRSAQSKLAGRLEYVLQNAEDLQRVECAGKERDRPTGASSARLTKESDRSKKKICFTAVDGWSVAQPPFSNAALLNTFKQIEQDLVKVKILVEQRNGHIRADELRKHFQDSLLSSAAGSRGWENFLDDFKPAPQEKKGAKRHTQHDWKMPTPKKVAMRLLARATGLKHSTLQKRLSQGRTRKKRQKPAKVNNFSNR